VRSTEEARRAFAAVVGAEWVETGAEELERAGTATFATRARPGALVRPASREEVQGCVAAARESGLALYPVSRGRNWGYGSRAPVADGAVLLSLERLDAIVDHDERLGYATVQPGVSFRRLAEFLRERGSRLSLNPPGSTPEASVVGNTLERGVVQGAAPDRAGEVCALEVVLPDGRCIRTGMAGLPGSRAARVHRWGIGPSLDGLFLQSSLGIVTEMTVWLRPFPAFHQHFHFTLQHDGSLEPALDTLQRLRAEESVTTSIALHNDFKLLSLFGQYPWALAAGRTPLDDALRQRLVAPLGGGAWFGEAALHASTAGGLEALRERVEGLLGPRVRGLGFTEVNAPGPFFGGAAGDSLAQAYWRKTAPPPPDPDPDRDRCGVIWHAPVAPFEPESVRACASIAREVLLAHGFEPALSLQAVSARCVYVVVSILFDRCRPGEDEKAVRCHAALAAALGDEGFHPYRLGLLDAAEPPPREEGYRALLHTLKTALDPDGMMAPGRYDAAR
jgi:4-cresol dehydrogenase (hydroxylating)